MCVAFLRKNDDINEVPVWLSKCQTQLPPSSYHPHTISHMLPCQNWPCQGFNCSSPVAKLLFHPSSTSTLPLFDLIMFVAMLPLHLPTTVLAIDSAYR